jgi:DNA-binding NtrC family response regulator
MSAMTKLPVIYRADDGADDGAGGGVLIASPSRALREQVLQHANSRWGPVHQALGGAEALGKLEDGDWQILFLDRRLPDLDSGELMGIIQQRFPEIQVVLLDSDAAFPAEDGGRTEQTYPDPTAPDACHGESSCRGVEDWSLKEKDKDKNKGKEKDEKDKDRDPDRDRDGDEDEKKEEKEYEYEPLPGMIGRSQAMQRIYRLAQLVAPRTTTVLIVGPTGSGKELVARALHQLSPRAARPFVAVNCAAIPEALLESELFGHTRGAFTGAVQAQVGRIPTAHGGTLFLDEVSELPFGMQAKLLRFLEQKEVQRLGTAELTRVDVRVVAASNVDLAGRTGRGEFREDLFYRLSAFPLELPWLSERRADIVPLAEHFLASMAVAMSGPCPHLSREAICILEAHPWKGNVRELQHVMERASILVENGDTVLPEHLYFPFQHALFKAGPHVLSCTA